MGSEQRGRSHRWLTSARHPVRRDGVIAVALVAPPWAIAWALAPHHHLDATAVTVLGAVTIPLATLWLTWAAFRNASRPTPEGSAAGPGVITGAAGSGVAGPEGTATGEVAYQQLWGVAGQPVATSSPSVPESAGHAFISYMREDSHYVDELQRNLEDAGISVWRDKNDLWPGDDWRIMISRAITDNTLVFIACFSRNNSSRTKSYQNEELLTAIEQFRLRRPDVPWLIPVRFDDCPIPDLSIGAGRTLGSIQRADLFGAGRDVEMKRLVTVVLRLLHQRPPDQDSDSKYVTTQEMVYRPVTRQEVTELIAQVSQGTKTAAERSLLMFEYMYRDYWYVDKNPVAPLHKAPGWVKHFLTKLQQAGLPLPASHGGEAERGASAQDIETHLRALSVREGWTKADALLDLESLLPEAAPIVVSDVLAIQTLEYHHFLGWWMQLDLLGRLALHDDPIIVRAIGTIGRQEDFRPSNSFTDGLARYARQLLLNDSEFERWFLVSAGIKYQDYLRLKEAAERERRGRD